MKEILLCSTPRSGSTLLAEAMYRTDAMGVPDEFFNNDQNNKGDRPHTIFEENYIKLGATSYEDYCEKLANHYMSSNEVHSLKMHFQHFRQALRSGYFRRPCERHYVFIHREDVAAQAASLAIAMKTQKWNSRMKTSHDGEVEVADEVLARVFRELVFDNMRWQAFFKMFNMPYLTLEYDEVTSDPVAAVKKIAEFSDVELEQEKLDKVTEQLTGKKQSTDRNAELKRRLSEMRIEDFGPGNIMFDTKVLFAED